MCQYQNKVSFSTLKINDIEDVNIEINTGTSGEIPLNIPEKSSFMFDKLTNHVYYVLENGKVLNCLKN